ncbi:hypothetical protein M9H77_07562 [Catharanthus roseus]|uniref:Uncharacterized protein n=1 Tax=Catharanthus roseus TaxID=4058 RepID=A0ACC0BV96_CATRO|nr:hypothetical protein M9H77_07562 [Catharanthus roseus]
MIWKNVSANAYGAPRTKSGSPKRGHHNQVPASRSQHKAKHHMSARLQNNRAPISLVKTGYRLLGHLPSLPWGQPQFQAPPDSPLRDRPTAEHDAMSMYISVGPRPQGTTLLFKWIHPQSQNPSTSSEEALVLGTSHVQCIPLTRSFT